MRGKEQGAEEGEVEHEGDRVRRRPGRRLKEHTRYTVKDLSVHTQNALPGKHKVVYSYDPARKTDKYLITNELTWEGLKVVKESFQRWTIEEFFRIWGGACVRKRPRSDNNVVPADSETGPITVQSVVRPTILENPQNFVSLIKSSEGETFLDRWLVQLNKDAIRKRVAKSDVVYLDQDADAKEVKQHVAA